MQTKVSALEGYDHKLEVYEDMVIYERPKPFGKINLLEFKNNFFSIINNKNSENWVDIENEYYYQLKKIILKESLDISITKEYWSKEQKKQVEKLNEEFEEVKQLLEKYLIEKVEKKYLLSENVDVEMCRTYDILKPISIFSNEDKILKEFIFEEDIKEIQDHFENEKFKEIINNIHFVNFNFTKLTNIYSIYLNRNSRTQSSVNCIHGILDNKKSHKINFGFGDEMDDDYKTIENINDNEYLKNFKSFQYLQNSYYSDLLKYIDGEKFQVYIMGHSCGLSDRTLLNTIFEHKNCRSIKIFYHQKEDGSDNYTEITQNISRHFNNKKLMRAKIVNKTLCEPLPQIQLPKKV